MKSLHEYITERLEQYKEKNRVITVYSSTKTKLSMDDIEKLGEQVYKDYLKAVEIRNEEAKKRWEEGYEARKKRVEEPAWKWAKERWKTEARQQKYVDEKLKRFEEDEKYYTDKYEKEGYTDGEFYMNVHFSTELGTLVLGKNYRNGDDWASVLAGIKKDPKTEEFFDAAEGWEFVSVYREKDKYAKAEFRLILPPNMVRKIKDNRIALDKSVSDFYNNPPAGCDPRWWGD